MNLQEVKARASGQWSAIAQRFGIDAGFLDGRPCPCPKCGGKDRFRVFSDFEDTGGAVCNQCGKFGDGIALVRWFCDLKLNESIEKIATELGLEIKKSKRQAKGSEKDPSKHLKQLAWSEQSVTFFAAKKKPITLAGLKAASAVRARYRDQYPVFAIPIVGQSKQAGWCLIHATGKDLPYWTTGSKEPEWAKVKITAGSEAGLMGSAAREGETVVFKVEGVSDCLALLSLPLPDHVGVVTNAFGCGEDPAKNPWILERFRGKIVYVIHDCDIPGQDGAIETKNGKNTRPGWAKAIATVAKEVRNVVLPYPIEQSHGKDLRDWINEQFEAGLLPDSIVVELLAMCEKSLAINIPEDFELIDTEEPTLEDEEREHIDDPHRLARLNLRKYQESHGRSLVYWKETWYSYQDGVYQQIGTDHLISRINYSIKEEFDRAWLEEARKYKEWRKSDKYDPERDRGMPRVRKVTSALVHNVYSASKGLCTLRSSQELHDWIDRSTAPKGLCIAVGNGILNLSAAIMPGKGKEEVLLPHSKNWFSTTRLDFDFDENAQCHTWQKFLFDVFNGDLASIEVLQKWFGYLLVPDNRLQKILFVIGPPRSGKGTVIHVMKSLFGESAVATPTLAELAKDFSLEPLIQKTVAIIPDARLSDRVDQTLITERLLSISGGDPQNVQRKYKETLSAANVKARFTLFSNLLPKLTDHSMAFISRCVFLHMPNSYLGKEDYSLGDRLQAELPGILNWAIYGRHLLNRDLRLNQPAGGEKLRTEMKSLMSPIFTFLEECCEVDHEGCVDISELFSNWETWCQENQIAHPGNTQAFSRKVKAINPAIEVEQYRTSTSSRNRRFRGIKMKDQEPF